MSEIEEGMYRHYKGGLYHVLGVAAGQSPHEDGEAVFYIGMENGKLYWRMKNDFLALVQDPSKEELALVKRFERLNIE